MDTAPSAYGELCRSDDVLDDPATLNRRLAADGYLYLPGYLDRDQVLAARHDVLTRLSTAGLLAPGTNPDDGIPSPSFRDTRSRMLAALAPTSQPLMRLLYTGRMINLYERLFGEPVRHFDYTWLRAIPPGVATKPHMDSVFMNRGTTNLLTAWTPLGDIEVNLGGLAILEGSHREEEIKNGYGSLDVDTYCSNREGAEEHAAVEWLTQSGSLADDSIQLREQLGLRLLTAEFRAGDLLTFQIFTIHLGLDNNTDRLRMSCDSRYQRASEPADPRWVGIAPVAHGPGSKRGLIC